ncbi:MAG: ATP-binding protein [Pseudomonadota bacterium]
MISPCPFSKGYRIPENLAWLSMRVFFIYRFILAALFAGLFFTNFGPTLLGRHDPALYAFTLSIYLVMLLFGGLALSLRRPQYPIQAQGAVFVDIVLITLLMHACGGITTGVGILLAVSVAAGGLLIGGRCAMVFAALASLAVLTEAVYSDLADVFETTYTSAGMLGASFFTISLLSHLLAQRAEQMDQLATKHARAIEQLQELNEYIIQNMQSGIIIVGENTQLRMLNQSARQLFELSSLPENIEAISGNLATQYRQWLANPSHDSTVLKRERNKEIHVRFNKLKTDHEDVHMIFLEDSALRDQRLQQSKLASLGRLTASIAHEVRNPLSAISHAAQLIGESPNLTDQDLRLTHIIHENSLRMNEMVEDILQLSKRTPSNRERIALTRWIDHYLTKFLHEYGQSASTFQFRHPDDEVEVFVDTGHLKQILDNLCLNAIKYGLGENGKIELRVDRCDDLPCVEVLDHGPGVDPNHTHKLFEPFFTTSPTGTGLGLFISRELAELNQAKLDYQPLVEGGSCFRLYLPDANKTVIEI